MYTETSARRLATKAVDSATLGHDIDRCRSRVLEFEQYYALTTAEMAERVKASTLQETEAISRWLFEAQLLNTLQGIYESRLATQ